MKKVEISEGAAFDHRTYEFGSLLRYFRLREGISQEVLGEWVGRSRGTIGRWEKGDGRLPRRDVNDLADALELGPRDRDLLLRKAGHTPEYSHIALPIEVEQTDFDASSARKHDSYISNVFGYLAFRNGSLADKIFPLRGKQVTVGRHPGTCDLSIPIEYERVSRIHMAVYLEQQAVFVEDLDSKNGTYVDGFHAVGPTLIKQGQHVLLGGRHAWPDVCDLEFLVDPGPTKD